MGQDDLYPTVDITVELAAPWTARAITEADVPWPKLLKMAQDNYRGWTRCEDKLRKARAQKRALVAEIVDLRLEVQHLKALVAELQEK